MTDDYNRSSMATLVFRGGLLRFGGIDRYVIDFQKRHWIDNLLYSSCT